MVKHMTQNEAIIEYIQRHGSITQRDAGLHLDVWRLSERIRELERSGISFKRSTVPFVNKYGRRGSYTRYSLEANNGKAESISNIH